MTEQDRSVEEPYGRMELMESISLFVNGEEHTLEVDSDAPLLWILRDELGLTGTKFSCGIGECGACTVLLDGEAVRSCVLPVSAVEGREIVTIEGLSPDGSHPLQQAWVDENVPQCGYCQPGQILTAVDLLSKVTNPSDEDINEAMSGVLCRCGTYQRIRRAIHLAAENGGIS
jgi:isoquinoline 1-oxidoreductase alpha subunit